MLRQPVIFRTRGAAFRDAFRRTPPYRVSMKTRKPAAKSPRRRPPHPLEAQLLLYREAVRKLKARAAEPAKAELAIDELISES